MIRLVSVGRFTPAKRFDRLIRIVSRLRSEKFDVSLWLLGDGELREELYVLSSQLGISEYVTFWGFQNNPYKYVSKCDLFVCSSSSEGYSTAVTEAIILGIPVITTDCSGMGELLQDGKCGVITKNCEDSLYEGIKRLLTSPNALQYYSMAASERGKDFSIERIMKSVESVIS